MLGKSSSLIGFLLSSRTANPSGVFKYTVSAALVYSDGLRSSHEDVVPVQRPGLCQSHFLPREPLRYQNARVGNAPTLGERLLRKVHRSNYAASMEQPFPYVSEPGVVQDATPQDDRKIPTRLDVHQSAIRQQPLCRPQPPSVIHIRLREFVASKDVWDVYVGLSAKRRIGQDNVEPPLIYVPSTHLHPPILQERPVSPLGSTLAEPVAVHHRGSSASSEAHEPVNVHAEQVALFASSFTANPNAASNHCDRSHPWLARSWLSSAAVD